MVEDEDKRIEASERPFRIQKNLLVLSVAFLFYNSAVIGMNSMQSSVNFEQGIGVVATGIDYGIGVPSILFLGAVVVRYFGLKYTIILGIITESIFILANMHPTWYTMIPGAVLSGVLSQIAWIAKCAYISYMGSVADERYGTTDNTDRYFGIYFFIYYLSTVLGTLYEHFVLEVHKANPMVDSELCGARFCDFNIIQTNGTNFKPISSTRRYILFGGYLGMAAVALALVASCLDQVRIGPPLKALEYVRLSLDTLLHFRNKDQLLLSFVNFYRGVSLGFMTADFPKAFVTCPFGLSMVGFAIMSYGIACGLFSVVFSRLERYVERLPVFVCFVLTHSLSIIAMLTWMADPGVNPFASYLTMAAVWGVGHSVLEYQVSGVHNHLFPDKPSEVYNAYQCLETLGESLCYSLSGLICFSTKLYIISGLLLLATFAYFSVLIRLLLAKALQKNDITPL